MNIILLDKMDFFDSKHAVVKGRRFKHLTSVNRVKLGDSLKCGFINSKIGTGIVSKITHEFIEIEVSSLDHDPPKALPLNLVLALPRPKMLKRILESVTSLGVKNIYLVNSWRVEKSFWQSPVLNTGELQKYLILGLEQSCDTILPIIHIKKLFSPFVNQELPQIARDTIKIVAHPKTAQICPWQINTPATLVIGPEGGFIEREIKTFEGHGFEICQIGSRILRVETAVTAIISRLF
ncbi:MAG: 16S rRNA (uracil(1498)-N(3))-methyltransferase [Desulfobacula sp.]|nr:16S rRNA (uracil(1498)-N(3))-methyltransferase [Desulfobacula sp.]